MVYCCVPFCKSKRGKAVGVSFHEFPTTTIRQKWLKAIRRRGTTTAIWCPSDRSTVCSLHFTDDNYRPGLKLKRLKTDAVPSRFPGYPAHLQSKEKPPRRALRRTPSEHKLVPSKRKRMGCPPDGLHATTGDEVSRFDESESSQILRHLESSSTPEAFTVPPLPLNSNGRARPGVPCQTVLTSETVLL